MVKFFKKLLMFIRGFSPFTRRATKLHPDTRNWSTGADAEALKRVANFDTATGETAPGNYKHKWAERAEQIDKASKAEATEYRFRVKWDDPTFGQNADGALRMFIHGKIYNSNVPLVSDRIYIAHKINPDRYQLCFCPEKAIAGFVLFLGNEIIGDVRVGLCPRSEWTGKRPANDSEYSIQQCYVQPSHEWVKLLAARYDRKIT